MTYKLHIFKIISVNIIKFYYLKNKTMLFGDALTENTIIGVC